MVKVILGLVLFSALLGTSLAAVCTNYTNATECTQNLCRWRTAFPSCVNSTDTVYLIANINVVTYGEVTRQAGWTIDPNDVDGKNAFYGPQQNVDVFVSTPKPPSATVPANPTLGQLVPLFDRTQLVEQPPLVQKVGTFAYKYSAPVTDPKSNYPKKDSFEYYFIDSNGDYFWGDVVITILYQTSSSVQYHCRDTQGGNENGQPWSNEWNKGLLNNCNQNAPSGSRPWIPTHTLPTTWAEITCDLDEPVWAMTYGDLTDDASFFFTGGRLNITARGRLGYGGQRVYGFQTFSHVSKVAVPALGYDMSEKEKLPQTLSFDKTCASRAANASATSWGTTFNGLPTSIGSASPNQRQCNYWTQDWLCANAPLLTAEKNAIYTQAGVKVSDSPWSILSDGCDVYAVGSFSWDMITRYCFDGKADKCEERGSSNVFKVTTLDNGDILVKFTFYNSAVQPQSFINTADSKGRGWLDIARKFDISFTLAGKLDFSFETGVDIFSVDIQWYRYQSLSTGLSGGGKFDRGLGINFIVYPEAYDAAYPSSDPRRVDNKTFHNAVPKKVLKITFYQNPDEVGTNPLGLQPPNPAGLPAEYLADSLSYSIADQKHFVVTPCATEATTTSNPQKSCDFQNITVRLRMANDGKDNFAWDKRIIFQFTLLNGERPNYIMDPNYKQTALSTTGAFTGRTATCRAYPEMYERDVQQRDPQIPYQGVEKADSKVCKKLKTLQECGISARESNGEIFGTNVNSTEQGFGCAWDTFRGNCQPAYSVTCEELSATTFGPTDRVIGVMDVTDVDSACVSVKSVLIKWSLANTVYKVYAAHPDKNSLTNSGYEFYFPAYEYISFRTLSELERNMYPLPQTNKWDYGFVFQPGALNADVTVSVTTVLVINAACGSAKNKRFKTTASSDGEMQFGADYKVNTITRSVSAANSIAGSSNAQSGSVIEGTPKGGINDVNFASLYITIALCSVAIIGAIASSALYIAKARSPMPVRLSSASPL